MNSCHSWSLATTRVGLEGSHRQKRLAFSKQWKDSTENTGTLSKDTENKAGLIMFLLIRAKQDEKRWNKRLVPYVSRRNLDTSFTETTPETEGSQAKSASLFRNNVIQITCTQPPSCYGSPSLLEVDAGCEKPPSDSALMSGPTHSSGHQCCARVMSSFPSKPHLVSDTPDAHSIIWLYVAEIKKKKEKKKCLVVVSVLPPPPHHTTPLVCYHSRDRQNTAMLFVKESGVKAY